MWYAVRAKIILKCSHWLFSSQSNTVSSVTRMGHGMIFAQSNPRSLRVIYLEGSMMEFVFTPDKQVADIKVPFYEDATEAFAPYYTVGISAHKPSSKTSVDQKIIEGQQQISVEMGKLGAVVTGFIPGMFGSANTKRYGYEIRFMYGSMQGVIKVAGLPMKKETPVKKGAVMIQALWNVRDWIKGAVTNRVFSPGADALIPFLLVDGTHTVAEYIFSKGKLPALGAGSSNVIDGEFTVIAG